MASDSRQFQKIYRSKFLINSIYNPQSTILNPQSSIPWAIIQSPPVCGSTARLNKNDPPKNSSEHEDAYDAFDSLADQTKLSKNFNSMTGELNTPQQTTEEDLKIDPADKPKFPV